MIRFQSAKPLQRKGLDSFPFLRPTGAEGSRGGMGPEKNGCDHANVCVWNVRYFYDVCDHVIMIILILSFLSTFRLLSRTPYSR
jgi:hypothetical protein